MYCTQCGNEIGDSARFCTTCGAPVSRDGGDSAASPSSAEAETDARAVAAERVEQVEAIEQAGEAAVTAAPSGAAGAAVPQQLSQVSIPFPSLRNLRPSPSPNSSPSPWPWTQRNRRASGASPRLCWLP